MSHSAEAVSDLVDNDGITNAIHHEDIGLPLGVPLAFISTFRWHGYAAASNTSGKHTCHLPGEPEAGGSEDKDSCYGEFYVHGKKNVRVAVMWVGSLDKGSPPPYTIGHVLRTSRSDSSE